MQPAKSGMPLLHATQAAQQAIPTPDTARPVLHAAQLTHVHLPLQASQTGPRGQLLRSSPPARPAPAPGPLRASLQAAKQHTGSMPLTQALHGRPSGPRHPAMGPLQSQQNSLQKVSPEKQPTAAGPPSPVDRRPLQTAATAGLRHHAAHQQSLSRLSPSQQPGPQAQTSTVEQQLYVPAWRSSAPPQASSAPTQALPCAAAHQEGPLQPVPDLPQPPDSGSPKWVCCLLTLLRQVLGSTPEQLPAPILHFSKVKVEVCAGLR